jgi:acetate kinase
MRALVINVGSSSVKYELFAIDERRSLLEGLVERVGDDPAHLVQEARGVGADVNRRVAADDATAATELVFDVLEETGALDELVGVVGHRVVHGGERFVEPTPIDDDMLADLAELDVLAPLHNPVNRAGIEVARTRLPDAPHVAVFDTAFHRTLPPRAYRYAVPREWYGTHRVRRYGFHGPSHAYVAREAAAHLGRDPAELATITAHLGNGCSMAAILGGESVDTSMGMTPLEGLVMGTRSGDVDPALPGVLSRVADMDADHVDDALHHRSGLLGMCGVGDMREVRHRAEQGDDEALLALDVFCYRVKKYVGAYVAAMGRLDALAFTAGIGEHDAEVRARVCEGMRHLGIELDAELNGREDSGIREIGAESAPVSVLVVPTDEELEIAMQAARCVRIVMK